MRALFFTIGLRATVGISQVPPTLINSFQQAPNRDHYLFDMEANAEGDVWLYGIASDTIDRSTGMVVKFSQQGLVQDWAVEFMEIGMLTDIAIDDSNNVYVGTTDYEVVDLNWTGFRQV